MISDSGVDILPCMYSSCDTLHHVGSEGDRGAGFLGMNARRGSCRNGKRKVRGGLGLAWFRVVGHRAVGGVEPPWLWWLHLAGRGRGGMMPRSAPVRGALYADRSS